MYKTYLVQEFHFFLELADPFWNGSCISRRILFKTGKKNHCKGFLFLIMISALLEICEPQPEYARHPIPEGGGEWHVLEPTILYRTIFFNKTKSYQREMTWSK